VENRELFRWTFAASGLWLIISPFLLISGTLTFGQGATGDTGILMIAGIAALIIAGLSSGRHDLIRRFFGAVLGFILVGAPWHLGFSELISNWNAVIIGAVLILIALYEVYYSEKWYSKF
jgi:hypothetical protein